MKHAYKGEVFIVYVIKVLHFYTLNLDHGNYDTQMQKTWKKQSFYLLDLNIWSSIEGWIYFILFYGKSIVNGIPKKKL